jgi:hypothetical protein
VRLPLMVVALSLCLAAPAKAGFITVEFSGVVTSAVFSSTGPYQFLMPPPKIGDAFLLTVMFAPPGRPVTRDVSAGRV